MSRSCVSLWAVTAILLSATAPAWAQPFEPVGLYLTWQRDPTTTMTIDWHLTPQQMADQSRRTIAYRELGENPWRQQPGQAHPFPFSDRTIQRVELTGLTPATTYEFRFGKESRVYRFRTMPGDASQPIRIALGGDTRTSQALMEQTNRQAMKYDPDFIVWGGDLAYANGLEERVSNWYEWFDAIMNTLISEEGRVVPIVVGIGNHEVRGGHTYRIDDFEQTETWRAENAPYFYGLFAFPGQPGYGVLDFGNYLSLIALDSTHTNHVEGEQTRWLEQVLSERKDVPNLIPIYHVPAFPSHRSYGTKAAQLVLHNWVPLFERYGVRIAFENHAHTYKRTHPIRGARVIAPDQRDPEAEYHYVAGGIHSMVGEIDPSGIVFVGDGAWGVEQRAVNNTPENTWYMANTASVRYFVLLTLHNAHQHMLMISADGEVFDEYPQTPWRLHEKVQAQSNHAEASDGE